MKKIVCLLTIFLCGISFAQNQKLIPVKTDSIAIEADAFVGFDGYQNCFYLKNNVLFKKTESALLQYQNLSLGKISKVDILNPLKVVIFYEAFNSIIVLDNQLNEIQKVDFSKTETPVVATAIGISGQNKLWVFNSMNQQLGLYDLNSNSYQSIGIPFTDGIVNYQSDFNYFQWIDKQNHWIVCTIYGRTFSNGTVDTDSNVQLLSDNKMLFFKDNMLFLYDKNSDKTYEIQIVEKSFKKMYYKDQILSIFTNQGITNYKITIP
jgi:hypothetical protein